MRSGPVMKKILHSTILLASLSATPVLSADLSTIVNTNSDKIDTSMVPKSALSFGIGGNLNYGVYGTQYIYAVGNGTFFDDRGNTLAVG